LVFIVVYTVPLGFRFIQILDPHSPLLPDILHVYIITIPLKGILNFIIMLHYTTIDLTNHTCSKILE